MDVTQAGVEQKIEVPLDIAIQMKVLEFDKAIADAEATIAEIKKNKMAFLYDQNMEIIKQKYQK